VVPGWSWWWDFYADCLADRTKAQALREAKLRAMTRNPEYAKP
jgi:hypothetical protein